MLPPVCNNLLMSNTANNTAYDLRNIPDFIIPKHRTACREKSFSIRGPKIWNTLPDEILSIQTLNKFKRSLRSYFV